MHRTSRNARAHASALIDSPTALLKSKRCIPSAAALGALAAREKLIPARSPGPAPFGFAFGSVSGGETPANASDVCAWLEMWVWHSCSVCEGGQREEDTHSVSFAIVLC